MPSEPEAGDGRGSSPPWEAFSKAISSMVERTEDFDPPMRFAFYILVLIALVGVVAVGQGWFGIPGLLAILAFFLIVFGIVWFAKRGSDSLPEPQHPLPAPLPEPRAGDRIQVGVLSLETGGGAGDPEGRGGAFAHELITRLRKLDDLTLKPEHRMLPYKDGEASDADIIRELGVHFLVKGTLVEEEGRLDAQMEIFRSWDPGRTQVHCERPDSDWFEFQGDLAVAIARELLKVLRPFDDPVLTEDERIRLRRNPTGDRNANECFMLAYPATREFNRTREDDDFRKAESMFRKALELDPGYQEARTSLGFLYLLAWETEGESGLLRKSKKEFEKIHEEDPAEPVAAAELGYLRFVTAATTAEQIEGVDRALAAAAGYRDEPIPHRLGKADDDGEQIRSIPHNVLALTFLYVGLYEKAIQLTEEVVRRDPDYIYPPTNASTSSYLMGDGDEALRWADKAREGAGRKAHGAFIIPLVEGAAYFRLGQVRNAARSWRRGRRVAPGNLKSLFDVARGWIHAKEGDRAAPRDLISANRDAGWARGAYGPYLINLCALAEEPDVALELLRAQKTWGSSYRYLLSEPALASLRGHPGFRKLLENRHRTWLEISEHLSETVASMPELPDPERFLAGGDGLRGSTEAPEREAASRR